MGPRLWGSGLGLQGLGFKGTVMTSRILDKHNPNSGFRVFRVSRFRVSRV